MRGLTEVHWAVPRGVVLVLLSCAFPLGCGKSTRDPGSDAGGDAPSASGAAAAGRGGGLGTMGGWGGSAAGAGGSAAGGSAAGGSAAGTGGSAGATIPLPNATEEDVRLLEPLYINPADIAGVDLATLVALGARIGLARGYAMCRCVSLDSDVGEDFVMPCAVEEAGRLRFSRSPVPPAREPPVKQDLVRCLKEELGLRPSLVDALRCQLRLHQDDGRAWLERCSLPSSERDSFEHPQMPSTCPGIEEASMTELSEAIFTCENTVYCADGAPVRGYRCDSTAACADESDELSCFDVLGQDMMRCGAEIATPWAWCNGYDCGDEADATLCDSAQPGRMLCPDGSELSYEAVCDRNEDCADGADERHCLR